MFILYILYVLQILRNLMLFITDVKKKLKEYLKKNTMEFLQIEI